MAYGGIKDDGSGLVIHLCKLVDPLGSSTSIFTQQSDLNLGLLGGKRKCFLYATKPPSSFFHSFVSSFLRKLVLKPNISKSLDLASRKISNGPFGNFLVLKILCHVAFVV